MDWHKLQNTLFELDPTDPREDLKKLQAQANGGGADVPPTKDYVTESVEVPQGSMPLGIDSVADFAALAGVRIDEKQKMGAAGQAKGKDPMPKSSKPSSTGEQPHPLKDKLVGEGPIDSFNKGRQDYQSGAFAPDAAEKFIKSKLSPGNTKSKINAPEKKKIKGSVTGAQLSRQLGISNPTLFNQAVMKAKQGQELTRTEQSAMSNAFIQLMGMDPQETQKVLQMLRRMQVEEAAEKELPKQRDPSSKAMQDIRKSGAAGAHKDKKKVLPRKEKHKNKQYESIKDQLWAALNAKLS